MAIVLCKRSGNSVPDPEFQSVSGVVPVRVATWLLISVHGTRYLVLDEGGESGR